MRTRERTRKRHRNTTKGTFPYVSQHINTTKAPCTMVETCCSPPPCCNRHGQGPSTATRHWHCPRCCDRNKCTRAQRTSSIHMADRRQGTPIVGVESAEKKRTHIKFALPTMCGRKTRPTWHRPHHKQSNCASPYGVARRGILRNLTHRPCLSNDNVSRRHDTNHDRCMTACHVFSQLS